MNFYKRHLGDIAKSCSDLSQGQMGAYDLLLDWLYSNEKPLPLASDKLYRIGRATSKVERDNVDSVLVELFIWTPDGYMHKRASEEMLKASAQAETNRQIAEAREAKRRATNAARTEHESCNESSNEQTRDRQPSQTPDSSNHKEQKQKIAPKGDLLADVDPQVAADFKALRLKLRAPITPTAVAGLRREAAKAGLTLTAALAMCCERGWRGFNADWADATPHARAGPQQPPGKTVTAFLALDAMANPRTANDEHSRPAMVRQSDRPRLAAPLAAEPGPDPGE